MHLQPSANRAAKGMKSTLCNCNCLIHAFDPTLASMKWPQNAAKPFRRTIKPIFAFTTHQQLAATRRHSQSHTHPSSISETPEHQAQPSRWTRPASTTATLPNSNPMWSTHGDVNTNAKLRTTPEDVVKAQWNRSGAPRMHSTPRSSQLQRRWIQSAP